MCHSRYSGMASLGATCHRCCDLLSLHSRASTCVLSNHQHLGRADPAQIHQESHKAVPIRCSHHSTILCPRASYPSTSAYGYAFPNRAASVCIIEFGVLICNARCLPEAPSIGFEIIVPAIGLPRVGHRVASHGMVTLSLGRRTSKCRQHRPIPGIFTADSHHDLRMWKCCMELQREERCRKVGDRL